MLTPAACKLLLEEIFHFYGTGLPARRPNSMSRHTGADAQVCSLN